MDTCLSCGCGFGLNFQFSEPVRRGKYTLCPSCDAMEKNRGYCYSKDCFLVWEGEKYKEIRPSGRRLSELKVMKTGEERREYLLRVIKEKEVMKEQELYERKHADTVATIQVQGEEGAPSKDGGLHKPAVGARDAASSARSVRPQYAKAPTLPRVQQGLEKSKQNHRRR